MLQSFKLYPYLVVGGMVHLVWMYFLFLFCWDKGLIDCIVYKTIKMPAHFWIVVVFAAYIIGAPVHSLISVFHRWLSKCSWKWVRCILDNLRNRKTIRPIPIDKGGAYLLLKNQKDCALMINGLYGMFALHRMLIYGFLGCATMAFIYSEWTIYSVWYVGVAFLILAVVFYFQARASHKDYRQFNDDVWRQIDSHTTQK